MSKRTFFAGLMLLLGFAPLRAGIVFSNLDQSQDTWGWATPTAWYGTRFLTDGSSPSFTLNTVTLLMQEGLSSGGNFALRLYSNAGSNLPDVLLETLSGSANPLAAGQYVYTSSGTALDASTSYWLVGSVATGGGTYKWSRSYSSATTGPWTAPGANRMSISYNQAGEWTDVSGAVYFQYSIDADGAAPPVPEPGTWAAAALLAGSAPFARWRKRA